jgi:hypothetical protein
MNDDQPGGGPGGGLEPPSVLDGVDLRRRLANLRVEHEDLDASVAALTAVAHPDQVRIARLKKKKLTLRDEITRLEDMLTPDIIA